MICKSCQSTEFRNSISSTQTCCACELIHQSDGVPLGWAVLVGGKSGGLFPFAEAKPLLLNSKPADVAELIYQAALVGLSKADDIRLLQFKDQEELENSSIH